MCVCMYMKYIYMPCVCAYITVRCFFFSSSLCFLVVALGTRLFQCPAFGCVIFSKCLADLLAGRCFRDLVPWSPTVVTLQKPAATVEDPLDDVLAELRLFVSGQRLVLFLQRQNVLAVLFVAWVVVAAPAPSQEHIQVLLLDVFLDFRVDTPRPFLLRLLAWLGGLGQGRSFGCARLVRIFLVRRRR